MFIIIVKAIIKIKTAINYSKHAQQVNSDLTVIYNKIILVHMQIVQHA